MSMEVLVQFKIGGDRWRVKWNILYKKSQPEGWLSLV